MIAVDTNIIIRFLTQDDNRQYKKAYALFNSNNIFIPDSVILETEWVLSFAYNFSSKEICNALVGIFGLKNITLTNPTLMAQTVEWYQHGLDFSDAMHLAQSQQHTSLYTFDKKFSNKAKGLSNCNVVVP